MKPYLIVIDLDGTLLLDFAKADEETLAYLRKLNKDGHIIVLATGRPKRSSYFVYQTLNLTSPLINYNGALISNPTDPNYPITDLRIDKAILITLINYIKDDLINVFCEIGDEIFVQSYDDFIHPYLHTEGGILHIGPLANILQDNPNSALFFIKHDAINNFIKYLNDFYQDKVLSRYWEIDGNAIVEIFNPLVDKSIGFMDACAYYNIPLERTIAFGDGHNDIKLLKKAHFGVAMQNAHQDLLKEAKYVTDRFDQQGILKFLKAFFE